MSTPEERVAADLIRRHLDRARTELSALLGSRHQDVFEVATELLEQTDQALPRTTSGRHLLMRSPGPEAVEAVLLREQAAEFGTVFARNISIATLKNLRRRMLQDTHPWYGCELETEEVEGQPNIRAVYLVAPTQEPVD